MTATMTTAPDLDMTRLALEAAVDQLTRPGSERVATDDPEAPYRYAAVPSLLVQLDEAREANSGRGGAFAARSKPPLWIDATSLLHEIDREVSPYRRWEPDRSARVRAWSGAMHSLTDGEALEAVAAQAEEWVRRVRTLLDPTPAVELPGRCPTCGVDRVEADVEDGGDEETVRRHALRAVVADEITGAPTAWCSACAHRFEGEALWLLADHLDRQTAVEHLAVEG